jgi:hypothetical protein
VPHADDRFGRPAALALKRDIPKKAVYGNVGRAQEQIPRNIGDPAAPGARRPNMGVALRLCLGDGPRSPIRLSGSLPGECHRTCSENHANG